MMGICAGKCTSTARLEGKTAVVTGCNTGIGKVTVQDFYERGCRVIMACRTRSKAEEAAKEIRELCKDKPNVGEILIEELDLTSLESVRKCAANIMRSEARIDLLINNAGIMMCPEGKTVDGFEMQFGTNHLGHFLFTLLLLPKIVNSTPARIVILSSIAHEMGKMDFDDLNWEKRSYSSMKAYNQSKLANVLFAKELTRRLEAANIKGVNTYCLHPGAIKTELGRHLGTTYSRSLAWILETSTGMFVKTPLQGAQTTIYCAVDEACANQTGLYYSDCAEKTPSKAARDVESGIKLWNASLEMVGLDENYDPFKQL